MRPNGAHEPPRDTPSITDLNGRRRTKAESFPAPARESGIRQRATRIQRPSSLHQGCNTLLTPTEGSPQR